MDLIEGVKVKELKRLKDERGFLMEIMRSDWPEFREFGQVYMTACKPGWVKAWHFHRKQTDSLVVLKGKAKIVLFDSRADSPTHGKVNEFIADENSPKLIQIPPMVMHGFTALGSEVAYIANVPDRLYNYKEPDELREPFDSGKIPYNWGKVEGGG